MANANKITRNNAVIFGLGSGVTEADKHITGSRLPSKQQVLRCFFYNKQKGLALNQKKWETAQITLGEIKPFYERGNIPLILDRKACEKIIKLDAENAKLREIPVARRKTESTRRKIKEMEANLKTTFVLWPVNAEKQIKIAEDREFLKSMKTDRLASFSSKDKVLEQMFNRKIEKEKIMQKKEREK